MSSLRNRIAARLEEKKKQASTTNKEASNPRLERIKLAKAKKASQIRVAAAWTIAKTMLPQAPASVQESFATTLLANSSKVLTAALRQTAVNAHYTKLAEKLSEVHKVELNDLLEDESTVNKLKKEVDKELKTDDASKIAAKFKKAEDVPAPEGEEHHEEGNLPAEEKVELHENIEKIEDDVNDLEKEIMTAKEHELDIEAAFSEETAKEKKMNLANEEHAHDEQFELDINWDDDAENIADPEKDHEEQEEAGFFGPSEVESMEASLEGDAGSEMEVAGISDAAEFFGKEASKQADQLGKMMSRKAELEIIKPGEVATHFEDDRSDDRNFETDHEDSILADVAESLSQEEYEDGLDRSDSEPNLELPKAASKTAGKKAPTPKTVVRQKGGKPAKLGDVSVSKTASMNSEAEQISRALFGDDDF